jgi:predicted nucleotidyltransferase
MLGKIAENNCKQIKSNKICYNLFTMNVKDKNIDLAKKIITSEIEKAGYQVDRIILFGSRARGDYNEYSDWDFFVVVDRELSKDDWKRAQMNIRKEMRRNGIGADVVIKSAGLYEHQKKDTGFISYYVNKDGIAV